MSMETRHTILDALGSVLDAEHATAVLDHRKTIKRPLTAFAAKLLAKEFAKCPDPNAAAEEMIIRAWQGFKAEWLVTRSQQRLPAETVGSLSKRQLLGQGLNQNASDDTAGRVVQIESRRLEDGASASRPFALPSNVLGRI